MDSIWTIGLGFVLFNVVLVIVLNIVSNYIYDRVPIKAFVSVSIAVTGTLSIIWGIWAGKVPVLLGINLIAALAVVVLLRARELPVWFTLVVICAVSNIINYIWRMSVGNVSISTGTLWIVVMVLVVVTCRMVMTTAIIFEAFAGANRVTFEALNEISRLNHIAHTKIINLIHKVVQTQKEERSNISALIETLDELRAELDKNMERSDKVREELNNFQEELSRVVKIPEWLQKFTK